jgi:putative tryptophan/tyrosine transport system substrate-binding protein
MQFHQLKRREFITLLGGAAALPLTARAQQSERMRRVGVLMAAAAQDDPIQQAQVAALRQELDRLGWKEGRNINIATRFAAGDPDLIHRYAAELVAQSPDVTVVQSSVAVAAMLRESRSTPIVFLQLNDPVGSGFAASLAHPGGNVTGFTPAEFSMGGKMLEVLKDVAPQISRAAVMLNPDQVPAVMTLRAIEAVAPSISVKVTAANVHDAAEIERAITTFAREPNAGLIVLATVPTSFHRKFIIELAAQHRLPAVYPYPHFVRDGGLVAYGVEITDQYRQAASYVDRILKGAKAGDLPIQQPTKFELLVNLTTAKGLGLTINRDFLLRADEVIE